MNIIYPNLLTSQQELMQETMKDVCWTGTTNNVNYYIHDLEFSSDGMRLIVTETDSSNLSGGPDQVHIFNLASPYDVSSCVIFKTHNNLDFYTQRMEVKRVITVEVNPNVGGIVFKV